MSLDCGQYRARHQTPYEYNLLHEQLNSHGFFLLGRIVGAPSWRFRPGPLTEAQLTIDLASFPYREHVFSATAQMPTGRQSRDSTCPGLAN